MGKEMTFESKRYEPHFITQPGAQNEKAGRFTPGFLFFLLLSSRL